MARTKYEYLTFRSPNTCETQGDELMNTLGDEGWLLVLADDAPEQDLKVNNVPQKDYYFVREKE